MNNIPVNHLTDLKLNVCQQTQNGTNSHIEVERIQRFVCGNKSIFVSV